MLTATQQARLTRMSFGGRPDPQLEVEEAIDLVTNWVFRLDERVQELEDKATASPLAPTAAPAVGARPEATPAVAGLEVRTAEEKVFGFYPRVGERTNVLVKDDAAQLESALAIMEESIAYVRGWLAKKACISSKESASDQ